MRRPLAILIFTFLTCLMTNSAFAAEKVTLKATPKQAVFEYVLAEQAKQGLTVKSSTDYSLIFDDKRPRSVKFAMNWGYHARIAHVCHFVQNGTDTILTYEIQILSNPNTPQEQIHVATKEAALKYLPAQRADLEGFAADTISIVRRIEAAFNKA